MDERGTAGPVKLRVACIGGGPAGLLLGILLHRSGLGEVTVYERNRADDTFGFGVVFSDETLANLRGADPQVFDAIEAEMSYWPTMDVVHRGRTLRSGGHGFAALSRQRLLALLGARAKELGVDVRYQTEVLPGAEPAEVTDADLIVYCDGVNSAFRTAHADEFGTSIEPGHCKYIWFATPQRFEQFTFLFAETEWGVFQAHVYPFSPTHSTFIVETADATWERAGLAASGERYAAPGQTDDDAKAFCERLFAEHLGGQGLVGNNSKWLTFRIIKNRHWSRGNRVLLGDAVHTAHFSIGSGTKLAFEDAIALGDALHRHPTDVSTALAEYEAQRRPLVESLQRAALTSQQWFEHVDRYVDLPTEEFTFQLLTRSQRITYDNLFRRDPAFAGEIRSWFHDAQPADLRPADPSTPPMFYPFRLRGVTLANRVVVSPMAQYSAIDGTVGDWHLVHLGSRAVGGAGLVIAEMSCVAPEARITPGCAGLWNDEHVAAWRRVTDFVHHNTTAKIAVQLGHAGRKGSTKPMWDGDDIPLDDGNWELIAPSPLPFTPRNAAPREMTADDIARVTEQFAASARRAADAGFDWLELHMAHGYLLSSFLSPLTNQRTDDYGGSAANRMRFPLAVATAVRAAWPEDLPLSVRISATDWADGGFDGDDAVQFSAALKAVGVDAIDVSTGQVVAEQRPAYGRLYQTPFADRIRHEVDIPTMAVGAISSVDDVNTVILSGRADLCLLARPHLVDPYWTLNAALDQGLTPDWPKQYRSARTARRRDQQALPTPKN